MLKKIIFILTVSVLFSSGASFAFAQKTVNLKAADLVPHTEIFFSPQTATFTEGSTFEVPIFLNTRGYSVNAVQLEIQFDTNRLAIVKPSGGKSIIGL